MGLFVGDSQPSKIFVGDTPISKVFLGDTQVRPSYTPGPWTPGANTLAYYPLEIDTKDYSGNGRDGINSNVTFSGGIATFNGSDAMVTVPDQDWQRPIYNFTILARARAPSWIASEGGEMMIVAKQEYWASDRDTFYYNIQIDGSSKCAKGGFSTGRDYSVYPGLSDEVIGLNDWHLYALIDDNRDKMLYVDGELVAVADTPTISSSYPVPLTIGNAYRNSHDAYFHGNISKVILEDKSRTAQEVLDYYNQTKSNYGL